jgi:YbbR domain-containing protein
LLKRYVFKDFKLKILSLVLAAMLWFAVSHIGETRMSFSVKIDFDKLGKEFIIKRVDNDEVIITVYGPVSILKGIRTRDIKLRLNLGDAKEGLHVFTLRGNDVQMPKGLRLDTLKPDFVTVELDRVIEKRLKTIVRLDDKWKDIYKIKVWFPQYVYAEGTKNSLEKIDTIETFPIEGNFFSDEETVEIPLDIKDMHIKRLKPDIIKVVLRRY